MKRIKLCASGREQDIALIDAVVVTEAFIGARALWDLKNVKQIFLTRAEPGSIGFSSIGAALHPVGCQDPCGLLIELGTGGERVKAPIAHGLIMEIEVKKYQVMEPGIKVRIPFVPSIIALDGERDLEIYGPEPYAFSLELDGPRLVDISETIRRASRQGFFRSKGR
ncbi:MAG: hypothetical protein NTY64_14470 [Deltaproteobacteria bacterium]|nr:hypothetical protein [Deltaproteobacteria bacterium]